MFIVKNNQYITENKIKNFDHRSTAFWRRKRQSEITLTYYYTSAFCAHNNVYLALGRYILLYIIKDGQKSIFKMWKAFKFCLETFFPFIPTPCGIQQYNILGILYSGAQRKNIHFVLYMVFYYLILRFVGIRCHRVFYHRITKTCLPIKIKNSI